MTTKADELVAAWLLEKFRAAFSAHHLATCPSARVQAVRSGWECDCLSEVTRDNEWSIECTVVCDHGDEHGYSTRGVYDLPQVLEELAERDQERFECFYEFYDRD